MSEIIAVVDEFVLSLDSLVRIGGKSPAENDEIDDYEKIMAALQSAREKYGVHFEGDEANVLRDTNGDYIGSSMPVNIRGTFDTSELASLNHFIARQNPETYICLVPGCKEPAIKTGGNKYSNGQSHVKRNHPELVPFSLWNLDMLTKQESVWNEQKSVVRKRKASSETVNGGGRATGYKQTAFSFFRAFAYS